MENTRPPPRDARETARYIEQMARELRDLARGADLGFIAYLLGMAEDEAGATARRIGGESPPTE